MTGPARHGLTADPVPRRGLAPLIVATMTRESRHLHLPSRGALVQPVGANVLSNTTRRDRRAGSHPDAHHKVCAQLVAADLHHDVLALHSSRCYTKSMLHMSDMGGFLSAS